MNWQDEIAAAAGRIAGHVVRTPVLHFDGFGLDRPVMLKMEQMQPTGSFKARGAFHSLISLPVPDAGIVAASGGNHGAAAAFAASRLGHRARIFVPEMAGPSKIALIERSGADLTVVPGAYADALDLPLECVTGPRELRSVLEGLPAGPVLIDVAGLNPFDLDQLDDLAALADASDGEIVAVLDAGMTPGDAEDAAALFSSIGAGRVIATKLDIARRLGALLAFGEAGLAYAQISASPYIGDGLAPATALRLSRLLLEDPGEELPA